MGTQLVSGNNYYYTPGIAKVQEMNHKLERYQEEVRKLSEKNEQLQQQMNTYTITGSGI